MADIAVGATRPSGADSVAGLRALACSDPLWQLASVAEVAQHGETATELAQRAAALSITPALLAANAAGRTVVSAWVRTRPLGPVAVLSGGLDLGSGPRDAGSRRLATPAGAQARRAGAEEWAALLGGTVTKREAGGWHWLRYHPAFEPLTRELADGSALRGSIEDCF